MLLLFSEMIFMDLKHERHGEKALGFHGNNVRVATVATKMTASSRLTAITQKCPIDQTFQPVKGTETVIYSAHYSLGKIYIMALKKQSDMRRNFLCLLWSNSTSTGKSPVHTVVNGALHRIPEDHGRPFLAAYIICELPRPFSKKNPPFAVTITLPENINNELSSQKVACKSNITNYLTITPPSPKKFFNFTVCVTPLNSNYRDVHNLLEMVEFNMLLGADKIVFYNHSIHLDLNKILYHYIKKGIVHLYQWPATTAVINSHYYGQLAALNDCLHRYRSSSKYLVYQDLDEFIIPTETDIYTWGDLIRSLNKKTGNSPADRAFTNNNVAIYLARCTFMRKEWPKKWVGFPYNELAEQYKSIVLRHTVRELQILQHGWRSKYIMNPDLVEIVGIHDAWSQMGSLKRLRPEEALMYHYRSWDAPEDNQARVEDDLVIKKYGTRLLRKLVTAWKEFNNTASLEL